MGPFRVLGRIARPPKWRVGVAKRYIEGMENTNSNSAAQQVADSDARWASFREAFAANTITREPVIVDCPSCDGEGFHPAGPEDCEDCSRCEGYGQIIAGVTLVVPR